MMTTSTLETPLSLPADAGFGHDLPGRFLEVAGTSAERGFLQGQALAAGLAGVHRGLADVPARPWWIPAGAYPAVLGRALSWLGGRYLTWHRPLLEALGDEHHLARVLALAEGLGSSPAEVYGFASFEVESAKLGFSLGCTSLGFTAEQTAHGSPTLAYNHDFPPSFGEHLLVRRNTPTDALRSLSVSYPVLPGAICGVNETGLAASVDQAFATGVRPKRPGLFATFLLQDCLDQCRSVGEAVQRVLATPVPAGCMMTFVDDSGARAVVEIAPTRKRVRGAPTDEVLYTFNKYRVPAMEGLELPLNAVTTTPVSGIEIHRANIERERAYLARVQAGAVYGTDDVRDLLSDHAQGAGDPHTICCHENPLSETILCALVDTRRRRIQARFGQPCGGDFTEYSLDGPPIPATLERAA
jgi:Acyl-coenzyme A:6-aminopenicillanic acid acyl-transferase